MSLQPGSRLGRYEVVSLLGTGGMGEVYRARDTRLGRDVAIKVLLDEVSADPERLARFEREARVLASLNHPNIATLHGFETEDETHFLVMELVEGETLADRIARGPIPLEQAVRLFLEIADGLEVAHEKGIIHRDLKPANIKAPGEGDSSAGPPSSGRLKILDFGLAKALDPQGPSEGSSLSESPTLTLAATQRGEVMGTAAYMSPEQAKGRAVDRRADIWAFGACLMEALSGTRAFQGSDASELMASVLMLEPRWDTLPAGTPGRLRELLRRCLEKDPRRRLRDIGDARYELEQVQERATHAGEPIAADESPVGPQGSRWLPLAVSALAGALIVGVAGTVVFWDAEPQPAKRAVVRSIVNAENPDVKLEPYVGLLAISPDGRTVAYTTDEGIYVRSLDELTGRLLTEGGRSPFFSPDGQWIGYIDPSSSHIDKVSLLGGPPIAITETETALAATWLDDDTILYHEGNSGIDLRRVSAAGGESVAIEIQAPEGFMDLRWPDVLPGSSAALVTLHRSAIGDRGVEIAVLDLDSGELTPLVADGGRAIYARNGYLVYGADGVLLAAPFDPESRRLLASPVPVVEQVMTKSLSGGADFSMSTDGSLVYASGNAAATPGWTAQWTDRQGQARPIEIPGASSQFSLASPRISPDGTRVAFQRDQDIWVWEIGRDRWNRLTFDEAIDSAPVWTADGETILFASDRSGTNDVYQHPADGSGEDRVLWSSDVPSTPLAVTPDGSELILREGGMLATLSLAAEPTLAPLFDVQGPTTGARLSPDGRWLAYQTMASDVARSRNPEVFVRPFPDVDRGLWQISGEGGGVGPVWSSDGSEIFYVVGGAYSPGRLTAMMRVPVETKSGFHVGAPEVLFRADLAAGFVGNWDLHPDNQRLIVLQGVDRPASRPDVVLVQGFFAELERLAPRD